MVQFSQSAFDKWHSSPVSCQFRKELALPEESALERSSVIGLYWFFFFIKPFGQLFSYKPNQFHDDQNVA
jgi:hypothetical protein